MRLGIVAAAVSLSLISLSMAEDVRASMRKPVAIAAQQLELALQALAKERGFQVIYRSEVVGQLQSKGAAGNLTSGEALEQILSGTTLTYRYLDDHTVTIVPAATAPKSEHSKPQETVSASVPDDVQRVAQAAEPAQTTASQTDPQAQDDKSKALEEIVVTGTHIKGVEQGAAPAIVIDRKDIERTGYSSLPQLFETLPQNLNEVSFNGADVVGARNGGSSTFASGVSLRGLGPGSTLTLVNGQRRSPSSSGQIVDIGSIPLSAIERVEIVTGGESAIYGSDAVAGVVNLITRRSFDGAETQAYFGAPSGGHGGERMQFSQIVGISRDQGGAMLSYDFSKDGDYNLLHAGVYDPPSENGLTYTDFLLQPDQTRHSVMGAASYQFNDRVELKVDGLYAWRKFDFSNAYTGEGFADDFLAHQKDKQFTASATLTVKPSSSWSIDFAGGYSGVNYRQTGRDLFTVDPDVFETDLSQRDHSRLRTLSLIANGSLPTIGSITPKLAVGVERRRETIFDQFDINPAVEGTRTVRAGFAELAIPLVEGDRARPGLERLTVSLATRYDHYSDFGSTWNPQGGIVWQPNASLALRAAYSKAFRAPDLRDLVVNDTSSQLRILQDPQSGTGSSYVLDLLGTGNPDLQAERAKTYSFSIDLTPASIPALRTSLSYFSIDYRHRIDVPMGTGLLQALINEDFFPNLVNRAPTAQQVGEALGRDANGVISNFTGVPFDASTQDAQAVFPGLIIVDNRLGNVGIEKLRGFDFQASYSLETGVGTFTPGVNATYTPKYSHRVTTTSPEESLLNSPGRPVDFRLSGSFGWEYGAWGLYSQAHYVKSYDDDLAIPAVGISSWLTADLTAQLDLAKSIGRGPRLAVSATNLFDRKPPHYRDSNAALGFDPVNANAFGRLLSIRLIQKW